MRQFKATLVLLLLACLVQPAFPQKRATLAQQFYVMKLFNPNLKSVGVILSSEHLAKLKSAMARAALANGVKVVYAEVGDLHELGDAFSRLVEDNNIGFIWIPADDPVVCTDVAMKYLLKKAVLKGVGTCVPDKKWLSSGGTLYIGVEEGRVRPYFNVRLVEAMGMKVPEKYMSLATAEAQ